MRSKTVDRLMKNMPKDVEIFVDLYADLVVRINQILRKKGYTQKTLAQKLDKSPSEIHKWLSGEHNFTLRSIAKLQAELGETLLEIPVANKPKSTFLPSKQFYTYTVYINFNHTKKQTSQWKEVSTYIPEKLLENVG